MVKGYTNILFLQVPAFLPAVIRVSGFPAVTLTSSDPYRVWDIAGNQHVSVTSDQPALVAQFVTSAAQAYPSMAVVPPTEQFLTSYSFVAPNLIGGSTAFLMLVIGETYISGLYLDSTPVPVNGWTRVPGKSFGFNAWWEIIK